MNQSSSIDSPIESRARLEALSATGLLDSSPEEDFDRLTRLTCRFLKVPVALVSLVDRDRQFFKSSQGLPEPWASRRQTPLSHSFCQHVVSRQEPLIINDARNHPLVCENLAVSDLGVVGYLGIPLLTPDGHIIGSLCAIDVQPRNWSDNDVADISDLAALVTKEIELRFHLRHLRQTEQTLQQRTQKLEQSNKELEQFAQVAAHDLGNPLHTVTGFAELLQREHSDHLDAKGKKLLLAIIRGSRRMNNLLQSLLAYARSSHQTFKMHQVDLSKLLNFVLEDLESKIAETQAQIRSEPLPIVLGDETYLRLLFQNMIDNAIKYRGSSAPQIRISASLTGNWWHISIHDRGIGIEQQHLEAIFEPFRRIYTKTQQAGSGIGLATCKRIVDRHGGHIWAESKRQEGSVFHFRLPAAVNMFNRAEEGNK
ncbi:MAG: GAF domain-containing protein [Leptolyngbya sp. SIO4C5]|nr:GAF domain-containing protein [Leptolyngbya sp. SIO4C5]